MKVDAKEILKGLKKSDRSQRTVYVSKSVFVEFQKACGDVGTSPVLEELMRQFTESVKGEKRNK